MRSIDRVGEAISEKVEAMMEKRTPPLSSPKRGGD